jgi:uncharacterized protein YkwD
MAYGVTHTTRFVLLTILAGLFALVAAAGPAAESASAKGPCNKWGNKESNEITVGHARKAVLCLLNRERASRGIKKFDRDKKLQRASQRHTSYMQNRKCFSHQCPGEGSLTTRLRNAGWLTGGLSAWGYGENIAWASGNSGTPRSIVNGWMNSSGHRANILNRSFDEVGVGYAKGTIGSKKANGAVMTTDFGYKRG